MPTLNRNSGQFRYMQKMLFENGYPRYTLHTCGLTEDDTIRCTVCGFIGTDDAFDVIGADLPGNLFCNQCGNQLQFDETTA